MRSSSLALTPPSLLRPSRRGFQSFVSRLDEPIERVLLNRSRFPVRRAVYEVLQTTHGGDGTDDDCERGYRFDRLSMRRRRYRRQSNFSCSSKTSFIRSIARSSVSLWSLPPPRRRDRLRVRHPRRRHPRRFVRSNAPSLVVVASYCDALSRVVCDRVSQSVSPPERSWRRETNRMRTREGETVGVVIKT